MDFNTSEPFAERGSLMLLSHDLMAYSDIKGNVLLPTLASCRSIILLCHEAWVHALLVTWASWQGSSDGPSDDGAQGCH